MTRFAGEELSGYQVELLGRLTDLHRAWRSPAPVPPPRRRRRLLVAITVVTVGAVVLVIPLAGAPRAASLRAGACPQRGRGGAIVRQRRHTGHARTGRSRAAAGRAEPASRSGVEAGGVVVVLAASVQDRDGARTTLLSAYLEERPVWLGGIDKRFFYVKTDFCHERRRLPRPDRAG
jgi:hypothetical protein